MKIRSILSHTISQNAMASALRTVLQVIIGFGGSYLIIRRVDTQIYGAWALAFTFSGFLYFIDTGISAALMRYTAFDEKNTNKYFWTSMFFYLTAGLVGVIIILGILLIYMPVLFKDYTPSLLFLVLTLLSGYSGLATSTFTNTLNGLQLMKRSSTVEVIKSAIYYILVLALLPSLGIVAFPVSFLSGNLVGGCIAMWLLLQKTSLPFVLPDRKTFKTLFFFGLKSYGLQVTNTIKTSFLKILASWFFTLEYVAFVELAQKITIYIRQFYSVIVLPILPAASLYQAKGDKDKILKILAASQKILLSLGVVGIVGYILAAPYVIPIWLGPGYTPVIIISQLESVGVLFMTMISPVTAILQGLNRFKPLLVASAANVVSYLLLTTGGLMLLGFNGIFVGYALAELLLTAGFLIWMRGKSVFGEEPSF